MALITTLGDQHPCQISLPLRCPLPQPVFCHLVCRVVPGDSVRSLGYLRLATFPAHPSPTRARHVIKEGRELGQACCPLHKSMLATHNHLRALPSCKRASRMICSITFAGTEGKLTGLLFPISSLMPFLKTRHPLAFFQSSDAFRDCCDFQRELRATLQRHQAPSPLGAWHQAACTPVSPICLNVPRPDPPLLQVLPLPDIPRNVRRPLP